MGTKKRCIFFFCFQSKGIEDTIEDMLVRLDEFSHLADTVTKEKKTCYSFNSFLASCSLFVRIYAVR